MTRPEVRVKLTVGAALVLMLMSCGESCDNGLGPTLPPPTGSGVEPEAGGEPVGPIRNDTEPSFYDVVGFSGFSLAQYSESHIRAYVENGMSYGYNTVRVCSETGEWDQSGVAYLPPGPHAGTPEAIEDVKRLLRVTAEYPNLWVELISSCTIKHYFDARTQRKWARQVGEIAKDYNHVFINAINEPWRSTLDFQEVLGLIRELKPYGRPVGTDWHALPGSWKFPRDWMRECDWLGVHPQRSPEPTLEDIRTIVNKNGPGPVLFNETTSYVSDSDIAQYGIGIPNGLFYNKGRGTEFERKQMATNYMELIRLVNRARWYFHMVAGLHCERTDFWMPRWN